MRDAGTTDGEKIAEWNRGTSFRDFSLFTDTLIERGLTLPQIVIVLESFDNICKHCFDADDGCQCWNDE